MQINYSVLMSAVVVLTVGIVAVAGRRWSGPLWLVPVGCLLAYPVAHLLADRAEADAWYGRVFELACGLILATVLNSLHNRLRHKENDVAPPEAARPVAPPADPPQPHADDAKAPPGRRLARRAG
ncbi:hypothetical protein [Streptomyces sp. NPDC059862]|uniref:hypothetical protein n=1 Tax=unclassified Streptomyces TaxID=2593676 RepID=UPI00362BB6A6